MPGERAIAEQSTSPLPPPRCADPLACEVTGGAPAAASSAALSRGYTCVRISS